MKLISEKRVYYMFLLKMFGNKVFKLFVKWIKIKSKSHAGVKNTFLKLKFNTQIQFVARKINNLGSITNIF